MGDRLDARLSGDFRAEGGTPWDRCRPVRSQRGLASVVPDHGDAQLVSQHTSMRHLQVQQVEDDASSGELYVGRVSFRALHACGLGRGCCETQNRHLNIFLFWTCLFLSMVVIFNHKLLNISDA